MDRLLNRRALLAGTSAAASLALIETVAAEPIDAGSVAAVEPLNRVALTAFGSLELSDIYLGGERAIARERDINCRLYLATDGRLIVDDLDYESAMSVVQLSPEQHASLLAAFTCHASANIHEIPFHEPVQPKDRRS